MTTTTSYGTWNNHVETGDAGLRDGIVTALGDFADDYDVDAIEREYRDQINDALPEGVTLAGDEFYGPAYTDDQNFAGYPIDPDGRLDIKEIVEGIDFWQIAQQHDNTVIDVEAIRAENQNSC